MEFCLSKNTLIERVTDLSEKKIIPVILYFVVRREK